MNKVVITSLITAVLATIAIAGPPPGPYIKDANTVLLLHLDGNLTNSGDTTYTVSMSTIAGYANPTFVASQAGWGQCLSGAGGNINGCEVNPGSISTIPTPHTVEAWYYLYASDSGVEFTNCMLDLAAGRAIYQLRNAGSDINNYMQLNVYDGSANQWAYCVVPKMYDSWHHYAIVYNSAATDTADKVKFYVDGVRVPTIQGGTPVTSEYQHLSFTAAVLGRVWVPGGPPTSNLMPLRGRVDELRFSNIERTEFVPVELVNFEAE
ncbi:MAG: LamG domain-containing protein [bacterium]|nr:LamG domain-containing protein [bacterium]